jgi:hypothetical protein
LPVRTEWRDEAEPSESVEPDHDRAFLAVIPEYEGYLGDEKVGQEGEPMWWPGNAEWRKRE